PNDCVSRQLPLIAPYRFVLLGTFSLLVYAGIGWLSQAFVHGEGHLQRPIASFIGLYAGVFVLYVLAIRSLSWLPHQRLDVFVILGVAVLLRVTLLFSNPVQEDDFYRYLWDGKMVASGLNPYSVAPRMVLEHGGASEDLQRRASIPARDADFALILSRVNHPSVPTVYPPLAQAVFGLTALVAPGSLLALRLSFLAFDLGICGLLLAMLKHLNASPLWVLVYAWSPLVIKESINSAHYDVVPTFFLLLAILLSLKERSEWAAASLALAVLGKVYPLLLVPPLMRRTWEIQGPARALLGAGVVAVIIVLGYVPFLDAGPWLWKGTLTFAQHWQTNSLVFPLLQSLVETRWVANAVVAVLLGGMVLVLIRRFALREARSFLWVNFLILGVLFLLSPVGNPWYFLWIVPFLCIFPLRSWLLLSGLLGLYYLSFSFIYRDTPETFRWVVWLEYLPFYGMLLWEWYSGRQKRRRDESSASA
ncbi:MAG: glycosyltransferase 87 family protein, partial [Candidatus Binatia bacterium]